MENTEQSIVSKLRTKKLKKNVLGSVSIKCSILLIFSPNRLVKTIITIIGTTIMQNTLNFAL